MSASEVQRPSAERLTYRYTREEAGRNLRRYWTSACQACPLKAKCTHGAERRISRWERDAKRVGSGDAGRRRGLPPARQHGQDHIAAGDARLQRLGAGGLDRGKPMIPRL
jgi:hypothetical protein